MVSNTQVAGRLRLMYAAGLVVSAVIGGGLALGGAALLGGIGTSTNTVREVVPIAAERRMAIEPADELAEGATLREALALVHKHAEGGAVMCTHGDVMPMLLERFAKKGVDIGNAPQWPKGCTWVLETDAAGEVRAARYLPPPPG